jgi:hypothetical protein
MISRAFIEEELPAHHLSTFDLLPFQQNYSTWACFEQIDGNSSCGVRHNPQKIPKMPRTYAANSSNTFY